MFEGCWKPSTFTSDGKCVNGQDFEKKITTIHRVHVIGIPLPYLMYICIKQRNETENTHTHSYTYEKRRNRVGEERG